MFQQLLIISILAAATSASTVHAQSDSSHDFIRGITISCRGNGPGEWDSPAMTRTISDIKAIGATGFSYHPYARIGNDGSIRHRRITNDPSVLQPLADAKVAAMTVMVKPHIGYWGSKFSWRGEITFDNEQQWSRFFDGYIKFITWQATLAEQGRADIFCVGLEYAKTTHREKQWRQVIQEVRKVYSGKITYAANWDNYTNIRFWDALDYVGIQAYFPIADQPNPTEQQLTAGWNQQLTEVCRFAQTVNRQVIFTELGYAWSDLAATQPWDAKRVGDNGLAMKLRCMKVALQQIERDPHIQGVFLWKWFVQNRERRGNFNLQFPEMRKVIMTAWANGRVQNNCLVLNR